jgi:hypothetical protein
MSANKELDSTYQIQSQNEHENGKIGESDEKEIAENQNERQSWWIW